LKVLVILPYSSIYPPANGGMLRCFHVLHQLVKRFETTAIMFQERESFLKCIQDYPSFERCNVVSVLNPVFSGVWKKCPSFLRAALQYRIWKRTVKGPADGHFLQYYNALRSVLVEQSPDVIVLENTSCLNAVPVIRRFSPRSKIVLNAHNVDSDLAKEDYKKGLIRKTDWQRMLFMESNLWKTIDAFFACSTLDQKRLLHINKKVIPSAIIPNGVEIKPLRDLKAKREKRFLFCGSLDYYPNREGVQWFLHHCWSKIKGQEPEAHLDIIGSGDPGELKDLVSKFEGVSLHGRVPLVEPWYSNSDIVIVPLLHGSGTRLKVLEAMSFSKPVVSTTKGAEGIDYIKNEHLLIADNGNDFSDACCQLLNQHQLATDLGSNARKLVVQHYDWDIVGEQLSQFIQSLTTSSKNAD
jgi:glycosyltransferase involved in cell wall biosynthesis